MKLIDVFKIENTDMTLGEFMSYQNEEGKYALLREMYTYNIESDNTITDYLIEKMVVGSADNGNGTIFSDSSDVFAAWDYLVNGKIIAKDVLDNIEGIEYFYSNTHKILEFMFEFDINPENL